MNKLAANPNNRYNSLLRHDLEELPNKLTRTEVYIWIKEKRTKELGEELLRNKLDATIYKFRMFIKGYLTKPKKVENNTLLNSKNALPDNVRIEIGHGFEKHFQGTPIPSSSSTIEPKITELEKYLIKIYEKEIKSKQEKKNK